MGGERAQLCFTSPPYAEQRKEQYNSIDGAVYWDWFQVVQREIRQSLEDCGNFILNIKPHAKDLQRSLYVFDLVCSMVRSAGWLFVDEFCWLRTGIPQQVVHRYKNSFEPCYWFVASSNYKWYPEGAMHKSDSVPIALGPGAGDTNAARRQGKGGGAIQGNRIAPGMAYPSNVLDLRQNADAIGHPAAFPVQLPEFFLSSMTIVGDSALDPFLGSGTTLVACERLARLGRGIEISPAYVAVALQRLADMGLSPELVS
jgi:DNA modification methylase